MILLPFEVLPGWPQPEATSGLTLLMLTVIGPLALGAVITLLAFGTRLARRGADQRSTSGELEPAERA